MEDAYRRVLSALKRGESLSRDDIAEAVAAEGVTFAQFIRDLADRMTPPGSIVTGDPCRFCREGRARRCGTDSTWRESGGITRKYRCDTCGEYLGSKTVSADRVPERKKQRLP